MLFLNTELHVPDNLSLPDYVACTIAQPSGKPEYAPPFDKDLFIALKSRPVEGGNWNPAALLNGRRFVSLALVACLVNYQSFRFLLPSISPTTHELFQIGYGTSKLCHNFIQTTPCEGLAANLPRHQQRAHDRYWIANAELPFDLFRGQVHEDEISAALVGYVAIAWS